MHRNRKWGVTKTQIPAPPPPCCPRCSWCLWSQLSPASPRSWSLRPSARTAPPSPGTLSATGWGPVIMWVLTKMDLNRKPPGQKPTRLAVHGGKKCNIYSHYRASGTNISDISLSRGGKLNMLPNRAFQVSTTHHKWFSKDCILELPHLKHLNLSHNVISHIDRWVNLNW